MLIGIVEAQADPFPHRHHFHFVLDGRQQFGVSAFVGIAVVVLLITAQLTVRRAAGLLAVCQLQAPLAFVPCGRDVGEEVIVAAADIGVEYAVVVEVVGDVLVAQASGQVPVPQRQVVGGEAGIVALLDQVVRLFDVAFRVVVVGIDVGVGQLRANGEFALWQFPLRNGLAGIEAAVLRG